MSTTTTIAMTELRAEPSQHGSSLWPNYGGPIHMSTRYGPMDTSAATPVTSPPHHHQQHPHHQSHHHAQQHHQQQQHQQQHLERPRIGSQASMDYSSYHYGRHSVDEGSNNDPYDRQHQHHHGAHQSMQAHHGYPSLKRTYSQSEASSGPASGPYGDMVQDLRGGMDDGPSKMSMHAGGSSAGSASGDHKLLHFKPATTKTTVVDSHTGRIQQLELTAQLHGMFFLSEMPQTTSDGTVLQPELTCYRRNLFQISGSLITPRAPMSAVLPDTGETLPIVSTEVTVSSIESVDNHAVRLIVIPWKTPPPNSSDTTQMPDQEPPSLPLIPFQDENGVEAGEGEYAVYPIGWRRLQFRIATANNGRRKELQQHFLLFLKVVATLSNGTKVVLSEATTSPIVVRGRSPRNFQSRKEIPLLGSSAGSRGQALVETGVGVGVVAGPLTVKASSASDASARLSGSASSGIEVPRSAFTFTAPGPKMPQSPMGMRSSSYPTSWTAPSQVSMSHMATTSAGYPATTMAPSYGASESQEMQTLPMPAMSLSMGPQHHHQHHSLHSQGPPPPIRTQYASYGATTAPPQLSITTTATADALGVPRYVDTNPRPTKSPRHSSGSDPSPAGEYRYGPPGYTSHHATTGTSDMSPHSHAPPSASTYSGAASVTSASVSHDTGSAPSSTTTATSAPRDFFSGSATSGQSQQAAYGFQDSYKAASEHKTDSVSAQYPLPPPNASYQSTQAAPHYWGASLGGIKVEKEKDYYQ